MKKISLCLTTWKRSDIILNSFIKVYNDERIGEIVISSDADTWHEYHKLEEIAVNYPKIRLSRNDRRLGVYGNKHAAVKAAAHKWVIIFDSDNVMTPHYLDKLYDYEFKEDTIFAPDFAKPAFNYKKFSGKTITRSNVAQYMTVQLFDCLLNTMNYFICRDTYLKVWKPKPNIIGADSIHYNKLWLSAGNKIHVVPGLQYEHGMHSGSYFMSVAKETAPLLEGINKELKAMR